MDEKGINMKQTFKQFLTEEHDFRELQKRMKPLTDQEREQATKAQAVMQDARGTMVPAIWKSVNQAGADVFISPLPKPYRMLPSLQTAINTFLQHKRLAGQ